MVNENLSNFVFTIIFQSCYLTFLAASQNSMSYHNEFWKTSVWNMQAYLNLNLNYDITPVIA